MICCAKELTGLELTEGIQSQEFWSSQMPSQTLRGGQKSGHFFSQRLNQLPHPFIIKVVRK